MKIKNLFDSATIWGSAHRSWSILSGGVTSLLIILFTSSEFQGYFYTFTSLALLIQIGDMGLNSIFIYLISRSSNKFSIIRETFKSKNENLIDFLSINKMLYLYSCVSALVISPIILFIGYFVLSGDNSSDISWKLGWVLLSIIISLDFISQFIFSQLEGFRDLTFSYRLRFIKAIVTSLILWLIIIFFESLISISISILTGLFIFFFLYNKKYSYLIRIIFNFKIKNLFLEWKIKIWNFQYRMILSWIFGSYFLYVVNVLFIFKILGPIQAGIFGLSYAICESILSLSYIFVDKNIPLTAKLTSRNKIVFAKKLLLFRTLQSILLTIVIFLAFCLILSILKNYFVIFELRLLSIPLFAIIIFAGIIRHIIRTVTVFIRSFSREDMYIAYVISGIMNLILNYFFISNFELFGAIINILVIHLLILLPLTIITYYKFNLNLKI